MGGRDGVPYAIDFMNPAPDMDINSLTPEYFEWVVTHMADLVIRLAQGAAPRRRRKRWRPSSVGRRRVARVSRAARRRDPRAAVTPIARYHDGLTAGTRRGVAAWLLGARSADREA